MNDGSSCLASALFNGWKSDVLSGVPPVLYAVGEGELGRVEVGPQLVTLIGGPPGAGKTALTMQFVTDGLRLNPSLRVLVCNVEMPPVALLDRQLARLSGIDLSTIRQRSLNCTHRDRLDQAFDTLESVADRLCFLRPPFDIANICSSGDAFGVNLLLLDYIQRIAPPGQNGDRRASVDSTMQYIREIADAGVAVIVVAAVARQKDTKGRSSYDHNALNLASYRESSELEFGADNAYILAPDPKKDTLASFRHLKARFSEPKDIALDFDRGRQQFVPVEDP